MQENAHGTGLKAGIQLGCLGPIWVGWMDWMDLSGSLEMLDDLLLIGKV